MLILWRGVTIPGGPGAPDPPPPHAWARGPPPRPLPPPCGGRGRPPPRPPPSAVGEPTLLPPVWGGPALAIGDFSIPRSQVAILALSAACGLAVSALFRRTRFGLALRASAADPEAARLMGMDP